MKFVAKRSARSIKLFPSRHRNNCDGPAYRRLVSFQFSTNQIIMIKRACMDTVPVRAAETRASSVLSSLFANVDSQSAASCPNPKDGRPR